MNPYLPAGLAVVAAYLIGAIPFAYLVVRAVKGVDIRTVGSGNVGATNAGRLLGFRYFVIVFLLDVAKGLLPTLGLPRLAAQLAGRQIPGLVVLVALAAILGHNFPAYLRFKGGKGVATSLGAACALDAVASAASAAGFVASLVATRYVSVSSVVGGMLFAVVYFARAWGHAWDENHSATSLLIVALLGMLIVRHRKNFARIAAGTESKVNFRRRKTPPAGCTKLIVPAILGVAGLAGGLAAHAMRPPTLDCGPFTLAPVARAETGHQRAGRLTFAAGGRLLAVCCPRYNRVVLYRVTDGEALEVVRDIPLEGRPVAIRPRGDRLYVLQRPTADARHVEAGWWETFDLRGNPVGERYRVGFDPDDLDFSPDGRYAYVLLSGRAEGESNRPPPALVVLDLAAVGGVPRPLARLEFDRPGDDPERLILAGSGGRAFVALGGSEEVAEIDLADSARPRLVTRSARPSRDSFDPSAPDGLVEASASGREVVRAGACLVGTLPEGSALEVFAGRSRRLAGRLSLRGIANLGGIRPAGLAYCPERGLLAVSNRQGGSVHLVAIRPKGSDPALRPGPQRAVVAGVR